MGSLGVKKLGDEYLMLGHLASEGGLRSDTFSKNLVAANFFYSLILISGL